MADKTIGECIKAVRIHRGMTQQKLAYKLGVARQTVIAWESGDYIPSAYSLADMADVFNVSIDVLVGRVKLGD